MSVTRLVHLVVGAAVILASCTAGHATFNPPSRASPSLHDVATKTTVVFCSPDHHPLKMDLYRPRGVGPFPVVIRAHGGGWTSGDRATTVDVVDVDMIIAAGIAYASIDYRLAPSVRFPAPMDDVACAVRFIRAHASDLRLEADHVAAMGDSAGGQLVSLLGTDNDSGRFDVGEYLGESSRVQAVVDLWGPSTFDDRLLERAPHAAELFAAPRIRSMAQYSPIRFVSKDDPPFLIIQGAQDELVAPYQSEAFYKALRRAHVSAQLRIVEHAGHGLHAVGEIKPSIRSLRSVIVDFLRRALKR